MTDPDRWDLQLMGQVQCLRQSGRITGEQIDELSDGQFSVHSHELLARATARMVGDALRLGASIQVEDIRFSVHYDPIAHDIGFTARWNPQTEQTELVGGFHDGRVVARPSGATTIWMADRPVGVYSRPLPPPPPGSGDEYLDDKLTYRVRGWRPGARVWIAELTDTSKER